MKRWIDDDDDEHSEMKRLELVTKKKKFFCFQQKKLIHFFDGNKTEMKTEIRCAENRIERKNKKKTHTCTQSTSVFFIFLNFCAKKRFGIERGEIFEIFLLF